MDSDVGMLNLAPQRGPNVWDRRAWDYSKRDLDAERWMMGLAGFALAAYGLGKRSFRGAVLFLAGTTLVYRAANGRNDFSTVRSWLQQCCLDRADDPVEGASAESFPASDAPAWTPTAGPKRKPR